MLFHCYTIFLSKENLILFEILIFILGLAVGSFLNVVIVRYPEMLKRLWRKECEEFLSRENKSAEPFNLSHPASHCPHCKKLLRWFHNIPLVSYFFLKGKCAYCEEKISALYPFVELLTAILSLVIAMYYHLSGQMVAALFFTWMLIVMSFIDMKEQIIPDDCNYLLLWTGLLLSLTNSFATPIQSILGAAMGYISLWIMAKLFYLIRKKEGMGHGDFKLFAALGAWFGWQALPAILMIAVITCLITTLIVFLIKKMKFDTPIPFGPFLAIGGWILLIWEMPILILTMKIFLG